MLLNHSYSTLSRKLIAFGSECVSWKTTRTRVGPHYVHHACTFLNPPRIKSLPTRVCSRPSTHARRVHRRVHGSRVAWRRRRGAWIPTGWWSAGCRWSGGSRRSLPSTYGRAGGHGHARSSRRSRRPVLVTAETTGDVRHGEVRVVPGYRHRVRRWGGRSRSHRCAWSSMHDIL